MGSTDGTIRSAMAGAAVPTAVPAAVAVLAVLDVCGIDVVVGGDDRGIGFERRAACEGACPDWERGSEVVDDAQPRPSGADMTTARATADALVTGAGTRRWSGRTRRSVKDGRCL
ncbi:MAG: hypothetical protein NVS3B21_04360 [Acidimicrobiales bacterium]